MVRRRRERPRHDEPMSTTLFPEEKRILERVAAEDGMTAAGGARELIQCGLDAWADKVADRAARRRRELEQADAALEAAAPELYAAWKEAQGDRRRGLTNRLRRAAPREFERLRWLRDWKKRVDERRAACEEKWGAEE